MANKKVTYDIDFRATDSASGVARQVTTEVKQVATAGAAAVSEMSRALQSGAAVTAAASANGINAFNRFEKGIASAGGGAASAFADAMSRIRGDAEEGTVDLSQNIAVQRKVIKDLEKQYSELQRKQNKMPPASGKGFYSDRMDSLKKTIDDERQALSALESAHNQYKTSAVSIRTQILNLRDEMSKLRMEGKANTAEYDALRAKLEQLGTAYRELGAEQKSLTSGASQIEGLMSGVQGLMGLYAVGSGVLSVFVKDKERLQAVQTKLQATMSVMIGLQQVANTLHSTSAFRITTVRKVTELWRVTQNRLAVSLGVSTAAAKAFMATITLGASVAITALVVGIGKLIDKNKEQREAQEAAAKAQQETYESARRSAASSVGGQLLEFRKLQNGWRSLGASISGKTKFIKDNQSAFDKLGLKITDAKSAEDVLIGNETAFIQSLRNKAMATAAMEVAAKHYEEYVAAMLAAENQTGTVQQQGQAAAFARSAVQKQIPVLKNDQLYKGSSEYITGQKQSNDPTLQRAAAIYRANYQSYIATVTKDKRDADRKLAEVNLSKGDAALALAGQYNSKIAGGVTGGGGSVVDPRVGSMAEVEAKLKELNDALKQASAEERAGIQKDIVAWQNKLDVINAELALVSLPVEPTTFSECITSVEAYDKAISANTKLLTSANESERAEIESTIAALADKKAEYESLLNTKQPATLDDFARAISFYEARLKSAGQAEQALIQSTITSLKVQQQAVQENLAALSIPAEPQTLQEITDAITLYEKRLKTASADERAEIQQTINALRAKEKVITDELSAVGLKIDPTTIEEFNAVIAHYEAKLTSANESERGEIQATIAAYRLKRQAIEESLNVLDLQAMLDAAPAINADLIINLRTQVVGAEIAKQKVQELMDMLPFASGEDAASIKKAIKYWNQYAGTMSTATDKGEAAGQCIGAIGNLLGTMSGAVEGNTADWMTWGANVLSSIAALIPQLVSLCATNTAVAATGAAASCASIPIVGWVMAGAAALSVVATLASIPKYADGGIAYGPTVGLFGEYSGAQNNPEVVAPLNKLKNLITTSDGTGEVTFRIDGRTLVGVLNKTERVRNRTK